MIFVNLSVIGTYIAVILLSKYGALKYMLQTKMFSFDCCIMLKDDGMKGEGHVISLGFQNWLKVKMIAIYYIKFIHINFLV